MKELITASTIRNLAASKIFVLEYSKRNSIVTPAAKDLAKAFKIELKPTDYLVTKSIYRKFCGVRPNYSITDRELMIFQVKEAVFKQYPNIGLDDDALIAMIDKNLNPSE